MAEIVFKNKKKDDKKATPEASAPSPLLGIFANYFSWFIVLVCVAVLTGGYVWLLKPKYDVINNNDQYKREEEIYQEKVTYLRQLRDVKDIYDSISNEDKNKIDSVLSVGKDLETLKLNLLQDLTYLAKINKAKISDLEITPLDNSEEKYVNLVKEKTSSLNTSRVQIITVNFVVNSVEYTGLKRILERLERNLNLMDVVNVDYNPELKQATLQLYTYYLNSTL